MPDDGGQNPISFVSPSSISSLPLPICLPPRVDVMNHHVRHAPYEAPCAALGGDLDAMTHFNTGLPSNLPESSEAEDEEQAEPGAALPWLTRRRSGSLSSSPPRTRPTDISSDKNRRRLRRCSSNWTQRQRAWYEPKPPRVQELPHFPSTQRWARRSMTSSTMSSFSYVRSV